MAERELLTVGKLEVQSEAHVKDLYIGGDPKNGTAGTKITEASLAEMNSLNGLTATAAELNYNDRTGGVGVAEASKTAVLGASKNLDVLGLPVGGLKIGAAGAEVAVTPSAAELNILKDATVTKDELNQLDNRIASFSFAAAQGASNVCNVTITPKDAAGATIVTNTPFVVYLSDAATGLGLTGTAASGTVTAKTSEGAVLGTLTDKKAILCQGKATAGTFILEITDTSKTTYYVCAVSPVTGGVTISAQLTAGNYGT